MIQHRFWDYLESSAPTDVVRDVIADSTFVHHAIHWGMRGGGGSTDLARVRALVMQHATHQSHKEYVDMMFPTEHATPSSLVSHLRRIFVKDPLARQNAVLAIWRDCIVLDACGHVVQNTGCTAAAAGAALVGDFSPPDAGARNYCVDPIYCDTHIGEEHGDIRLVLIPYFVAHMECRVEDMDHALGLALNKGLEPSLRARALHQLSTFIASYGHAHLVRHKPGPHGIE